MPLPEGVTVIDLRPADLRFAQPLERHIDTAVRAISMQQIEDGAHGLTPADGPLLVVCERGLRSGLAAKYLRADGLDASAYAGGVPALLREVEG